MKYENVATVILRVRMADKGVSIRALAKAAGVSVRTIQRLRSGHQDRTRRAVLAKVARKLGVKTISLTKMYSQKDMRELHGDDDILF